MVDVAIIGAGVVGSAIARELSKYKVKACVIEREEDLCSGTSKANSAIIHAGFDATPGTLKARLNVEGNAMMDELAELLDIPFKRNGSLVVRTKDQDRAALEELLQKGIDNGVPGVRIIGREEILAMEPNIADDVVEALYAPTGGIVCPFNMTYAFAENAADNGVEFLLNTEVANIEKTEKGYSLSLKNHGAIRSDDAELKAAADSGRLEAVAIINAAGVYADVFNNMVSDRKLSITPRRGEYMLLDKTCGGHVKSTIFQLPSKMGKGVLVAPTVHGNLLIGPTAENIEDKEGTNTTMAGLDSLGRTASLSVKNLPIRQVITSFAGLRASEAGKDFVLGEAEDAENFFNAAGIESPGLSSAPAIGLYIADRVAAKLGLEKKTDYIARRKGILNLAALSIEERNALIKEQPAYGQIICRCESISEGEILAAIHRTLGARSLDGIKRRVRAGMGRCQAGFCSPKVMDILVRETGMDMLDVRKSGSDAVIVYGYNKKVE